MWLARRESDVSYSGRPCLSLKGRLLRIATGRESAERIVLAPYKEGANPKRLDSPKLTNMQQQSQDTLRQGLFDFSQPAPWVRLPKEREGANPSMALTREQQMFEAWRDELSWKDKQLERIANYDNLRCAYRKVKSNKGAQGVDGMTVDELGTWLNHNMEQLRNDLLQGRYCPQEVKGVSIPKPNGGQRQLGIPTVIDRMVQQAIVQVITTQIDAQMSESSYGFRPNRSAHDALKAGSIYVEEGRKWAVDLDLEKFFDKVNHDVLMNRMARRINDKRLLYYIRKMLKAGMMDNEGICQKREQGTPQGGPLSPLLANVLLDDLDKELERRGHKFCRYADDCMIFVKTKAAATRVLASITRFIESKLKLKVNQEKSRVERAARCVYLGYIIGAKGMLRVAPQSIKKLKDKVRLIVRRGRPTPIGLVINKELNPLLRGWGNYFKLSAAKAVSRDLDGWIRRKLRCMRLKQCKHSKGIKKLLLSLGVAAKTRREITGMGRRWWRISKTWLPNAGMGNEWLRDEGLISLHSYFNHG